MYIDGYNFLPYLTGRLDKRPTRKDHLFLHDDGDLFALR